MVLHRSSQDPQWFTFSWEKRDHPSQSKISKHLKTTKSGQNRWKTRIIYLCHKKSGHSHMFFLSVLQSPSVRSKWQKEAAHQRVELLSMMAQPLEMSPSHPIHHPVPRGARTPGPGEWKTKLVKIIEKKCFEKNVANVFFKCQPAWRPLSCNCKSFVSKAP